MSAQIIEFRRPSAPPAERELVFGRDWTWESDTTPRLRPADVVADDDPAYELFANYKQAEAAYREAVAELARRTGCTVRQVAKYMQRRRELRA